MTPFQRLIAPNPGPFTDQGTNGWLLGHRDCVMIDPGPDDAGHAAAILAALPAGGRLAAIVLTHGHADHAGGAMRLSAMTGAPICAHPAQGGPRDAPGLRIDHPLADGEVLRVGEITLTALHTPGHHPGHLMLGWGTHAFSGDHVMGWATTAVARPDGDMAAYMASLRGLAARDWRVLHPGHGPDITDPAARIAALLAHREARHAAIAAALTARPQTARDLCPQIYPDLPPALHAAAEASLHAHLIALTAEAKAHPHGPAEAPETAFTHP